MIKCIRFSFLTVLLLVITATTAAAQAAPGTPSEQSNESGANLGFLTCTVAGGTGFIFGSTKDLACFFSRRNGVVEVYTGTIRKFGIDIGFTREVQVAWLVFSPGEVGPGALAGAYGGVTASAAVGIGGGASVLVGGGAKHISLQPLSVEGSVGLNLAAGIGEIELHYATSLRPCGSQPCNAH